MRGAVGASAEAGFSGRTHVQAFNPLKAAAATRRRRHSLPCRTVRAEAAEAGSREQPVQQQPLDAAQLQRQRPDPYQLAGQRLRSLLSGVGDGEVSSQGYLRAALPLACRRPASQGGAATVHAIACAGVLAGLPLPC